MNVNGVKDLEISDILDAVSVMQKYGEIPDTIRVSDAVFKRMTSFAPGKYRGN